jgi:transposase
LTGATAEAMADWLSEGIAKDRDGDRERMFRRTHRDAEVLVAEGYEVARTCGLEAGEAEGTERVVVGRSPVHAERQAAGLEQRLATAEKKLAALPPARGRGKRQITEAAQRVAALDKVLQEQRGEGWLQVAWEQQIERHIHYIGRGRGAATRAQRGREKIRSHITRITRQDSLIQALSQRFGWQAFVTNAPDDRLS